MLGNRTSKGSASKPDSDKYKCYECPCKESKNFKHCWDPLSCTTVEIAITGSSKTWTKFKSNEEQIGKIRERLLTEYWKDLKPQLEEKYGVKITGGRAVEKPISGASSKKEPKASGIQYPGNFNAALVDPILMIQSPG
jgi:hypothetical protein